MGVAREPVAGDSPARLGFALIKSGICCALLRFGRDTGGIHITGQGQQISPIYKNSREQHPNCSRLSVYMLIVAAALGAISSPARAGCVSISKSYLARGGGGSGKTGVPMREVPYIYHAYILPFGMFSPSYESLQLHRMAILTLQQFSDCL